MNTKFSSSLHCNGHESYLYASKTEICKFMVHDNIPWHEVCLGSASKDFTKEMSEWNEISEISLNGTVYDSQVIIVQLRKKIFLIFINI